MTKKILNSLTDTIALSCGPDGPVTCEPRVEEQSAESERDKFCKRLNHKATAPFEFFDSTPAMGDQRFTGRHTRNRGEQRNDPNGTASSSARPGRHAEQNFVPYGTKF